MENKKPQIRFDEFVTDWEQGKLEDYLEVSKKKILMRYLIRKMYYLFQVIMESLIRLNSKDVLLLESQ